MSIDSFIEGVIGREGSYSNNPNDAGGETMFGITIGTARDCGYSGPMRAMTREQAKGIYATRYVVKPGFADIALISEPVAEELVDTGVNMGPAVAAMMLQRSLNALGADLKLDGQAGAGTRGALKAYLDKRGHEGEVVLLKALNCLQGERYIELAEKRPADKTFVYGWLRTRVAL